MRSLSACVGALSKTLAHIRTMETSAANRRASDRAQATDWEECCKHTRLLGNVTARRGRASRT